MRALLALVTAAATLGACTTTQYYWHKNGATTQEYNQDKYRCMQESTRSQYSSSPVTNLYTGKYMGQMSDAGQYVDQQIFVACMQAAGYVLTTQQYQAPTQQYQAPTQAQPPTAALMARCRADADRILAGKPAAEWNRYYERCIQLGAK